MEYNSKNINCSMFHVSCSMKQNGFTLVEILIVIAIVTIILGLSLFLSMDFYKSYSFHSEKNVIVSILQKARSESMNNINQTPHGVYFDNTSGLKYILFEGSSYDSASTSNIEIDSSFGISLDSPTLPFSIVFDQLSGDCSSCGSSGIDIVSSQGSSAFDININSEGRITW